MTTRANRQFLRALFHLEEIKLRNLKQLINMLRCLLTLKVFMLQCYNEISNMKIFSNSPSKKRQRLKSFPPNGYLYINPLLSTFYKVKFRKLQVKYILISSRKIFHLKMFKAYDSSWQVSSFSKHCCAASVGEWNKGFVIQSFFICGILDKDWLDFQRVWNIRAAKSTI